MLHIQALLALSLALVPVLATGNSSSSTTCSDGTWMTQPIDHASPSNGTFQQQIEVRTEFFKPGGPILLFHGEESTEMACVVSLAVQTP